MPKQIEAPEKLAKCAVSAAGPPRQNGFIGIFLKDRICSKGKLSTWGEAGMSKHFFVAQLLRRCTKYYHVFPENVCFVQF